MSRFILKIDTERYGPLSDRQKRDYPESVEVIGTREQAENAADLLSCNEAGCDEYWTIVEERP